MVIVFVHGIFSSCAVFETLKKSIADALPKPPTFLDFSYRFLEPLQTNGKALNECMAKEIPEGEEVVIIGHSMGGLVSRMALMTGPDRRPFRIKYLIMLGTPNHGAVKMSQINGIAALVKSAVCKIPPLYSRSRGLDDLTRVNTIFNDLLAKGGKPVLRTKEIDYVTIPATLYNEDNPSRLKFGSLTNMLMDVLAMISSRKGLIHLPYPHDGIVAEESVRMATDKALDQNERTPYAGSKGREEAGRTANVHIVHPDFRSANHVEIHSIPRVCSIVVGLLQANGIDDWIDSMPEEDRVTLNLSNGELI